MNKQQFRLLIVEVLEHHLNKMKTVNGQNDYLYHLEIVSQAVNYLNHEQKERGLLYELE